MNASIIIPAYNRARTLGRTIESLVRQNLPPDSFELIVVDNNSTDATPEVVRRAQATSPVAIRYHLERRQGVHYARNWAGVHARGSILYYTDDDMVADPEALPVLLRLFELDSKIATASGRVLPQWEATPPSWVTALCQNYLLSLQLRPDDLIISKEDPGIFSCHQAIRKNVLLECGGFNPENTAGEWIGDGETGLCLKIRARGYKFAYSARAVTHHVIPPERMTQDYLNRRLINQGFADAFTWFRRTRCGRSRLRCEPAVRRCRAAYDFILMTGLRLLGQEAWRLRQARINYELARAQYCQRLAREGQWRDFVLRDNWIDSQPESEDAGPAATVMAPSRGPSP